MLAIVGNPRCGKSVTALSIIGLKFRNVSVAPVRDARM
jgi:ABC-type dipeptide/oligopeptide/nickel transport system ATPase component